MSRKLKKTLAMILSLVTVFSAAFTSMAEVEVVEEVDQIAVPEESVSVVAEVLEAAVSVEENISVETVKEIEKTEEDTDSEPSSVVSEELPGTSNSDISLSLKKTFDEGESIIISVINNNEQEDIGVEVIIATDSGEYCDSMGFACVHKSTTQLPFFQPQPAGTYVVKALSEDGSLYDKVPFTVKGADIKVTKADGSGAVKGEEYTWTNGTPRILTIKANDLVISGTTDSERIVVAQGVSKLTLDGVVMNNSETGQDALQIDSKNLELVVKDGTENSLITGGVISVYGSNDLTITGTGTLNVASGSSKTTESVTSGISVKGVLTVNGPTINTEGGKETRTESNGITTAGCFVLESGTVNAKGGEGIGGKSYGIFGNTTVTGGVLIAQGYTSAMTEVPAGRVTGASRNYDGSSPVPYNPADLASYKYLDMGRLFDITFDVEAGIKSVTVKIELMGPDPMKITADQFPKTLKNCPPGTQIVIESAECEAGYECTLALPYTYKVPDHDDTFTVTTGRRSDPKPTPVYNDTKEEREPLYTGTWNSPVKGGSWSQDANGVWHYTSTEKFRNTWGYIVNPYAKEGQNSADWFWFDIHGNMLTGWQFINGKWYYLNLSKDGTLGACQLGGVTPDGWTVKENGEWDESIPRK